MNINWAFFFLWLALGGIISYFLAPFVVMTTTGKQMTLESKLYAGIFTSVSSFFLSMFFGLFYVWLILANLALWFLLPMWWKLDDQKNKALIVYIGTNMLAQLAIYFLFSVIQLGI
jgi:hypothetical protein